MLTIAILALAWLCIIVALAAVFHRANRVGARFEATEADLQPQEPDAVRRETP